VYMGEPAGMSRVQIGIAVLLFLSVFIVVSWLLKRAYWKDVH
jgi:ubiquinol-cytochrome c reductase cytochrome c1 subunit